MNTTTKVYYRPKWMCGRYNAHAKVAITYNLLEGISYFFEDHSALVVSHILNVQRGEKIDIADIAEQTGILEECILPFFHELTNIGLVLNHMPSDEEEADYRQQISFYNRNQATTKIETTEEKLPTAITTAEMDYTEKAGGITSVMFELTYRCSEKCIHCYNIGATRNNEEQSGRALLKELQLEDYKRIIDELYEEGLVKVTLSGGDPFSCSFAWEIIDYLYTKDIAFDLYTNGLRLVDNEERLAKYYPRIVGISVYSAEAQVHDTITRIKGSWEKTVSVIDKLSTLGVPLAVKCCIMRPNVKSFQSIKSLCKKYGATAQFELNVTDSIEGDKCVSKYLRLSPEMLDIVLCDKDTPMYVGKEVPNYGGRSKRMCENGCGAGYNTFCVTPDGDLIPCCAFHMSFGNLKEKSIREIFNYSEKLRWWQNQTLKHYDECGRHPYCDFCNLCPGNNFSQHGTPLKAAENNCYMAKCRYTLAQKMKRGIDPLEGKTLKQRIGEIHIDAVNMSSLKREF